MIKSIYIEPSKRDGEQVLTPNGTGTIIGEDRTMYDRYAVKLDVKRYPYDPYYFAKELKPVEKQTLEG